jgi:hypothetical protein
LIRINGYLSARSQRCDSSHKYFKAQTSRMRITGISQYGCVICAIAAQTKPTFAGWLPAVT